MSQKLLSRQPGAAKRPCFRCSRTCRAATFQFPNNSPLDSVVKPDTGGYYIDVYETNGAWTSDDAYTSRRQLARFEKSKEAPLQPPTVVTTFPEHARGSVAKNGLVLVDKPREWSAFECVKAVRFAYQASKGFGHFGALDTTATGLVIVAMGAATKLGRAFEELPREYTGALRLGTATDTCEAGGKVTEQCAWSHVTDDALREASKQFCGEILQVPPPSSSYMVEGRPLYSYTKKGEAPEVAARPCYVDELTVWRDSPDSKDVKFKLVCGRSVYIRSIARDLGKAVGSCAHLAELRRHSIGDFRVEDAWTLDTLLPLVRKYAKAYRSG